MSFKSALDLATAKSAREPKFEAQTRIMNVVEIIAQYGPISAKEIQAKVAIAPATLTRILRDLVVLNWVVKISGHPTYQISNRFESLVGESVAELEERAEFADIFHWISVQKTMFFEFACFTKTGKFEVIEDNRNSNEALGELALGYDNLAIAAQKLLDPQSLLRHYKSYFTRVSIEEQEWMQSPTFLQAIRDSRGVEVDWERDKQGFAVAGLASNGNAVGFRIYLKPQYSQKLDDIAVFANDLCDEIRRRTLRNGDVNNG